MTAPLKLYEWGNELDRVKEMLYAAEGELTPEIEQALEEVEGGFAQKAENVALYIRELLSSSKAVKEEADRLSARAKGYERSADSLKGYLLRQMERAETPKIEGKLVSIRLQKSPPSVHSTLTPDDLMRLGEDYDHVILIPESYRLNSAAVIAHWKKTGGSPIDGVQVTQSHHLRIT